MAGGTFFYIDALNFYYGSVKGTADKWVDFEALAQALVPRDHIGRIKYFTAHVKPLSPGDRTHERQNAFLRAVDTNPLIEIVRGHFRSDIRLRALAERNTRPSNCSFRPSNRQPTLRRCSSMPRPDERSLRPWPAW